MIIWLGQDPPLNETTVAALDANQNDLPGS